MHARLIGTPRPIAPTPPPRAVPTNSPSTSPRSPSSCACATSPRPTMLWWVLMVWAWAWVPWMGVCVRACVFPCAPMRPPHPASAGRDAPPGGPRPSPPQNTRRRWFDNSTTSGTDPQARRRGLRVAYCHICGVVVVAVVLLVCCLLGWPVPPRHSAAAQRWLWAPASGGINDANGTCHFMWMHVMPKSRVQAQTGGRPVGGRGQGVWGASEVTKRL